MARILCECLSAGAQVLLRIRETETRIDSKRVS